MSSKFQIDLRRLAMLSLMLVALFALAGCGGDDEPSNSAGSQAADAPEPSGPTGEEAVEEASKDGELSKEEAEKIEDQNFSEEPPPIQILTGATTGYFVDEPTLIVAQSKKELNAMKRKHFRNGVKRQEIAPVDLGPRQVVGLFLPEQAKGTQTVITDIYEDNGRMIVKAVRLTPGKDCEFTGDKPRPFHWVETRSMNSKNVKLVLETQKSSPCLD